MLKDIFDRMDEEKNNVISSSKIEFDLLTPEILGALELVVIEIYAREVPISFQSFCKLIMEKDAYYNLEKVYQEKKQPTTLGYWTKKIDCDTTLGTMKKSDVCGSISSFNEIEEKMTNIYGNN